MFISKRKTEPLTGYKVSFFQQKLKVGKGFIVSKSH